jgi:hypothetical protein
MFGMSRPRSRRQFLVETAATTATVAFGLGCQRTRRHRVEDVREVANAVAAVASKDGAGVKLRRCLGHRAVPMVDPFLLLDEIHSDVQSDWNRGFPTHPHRGFETVSYLIAGAFEHRDSVGNHGLIGAGDCQWMTAGRGIVHSEMPTAEPGQDLWGLQLWVNLPAALKMKPPRYQDIGAAAIPELDMDDARVRVVTGRVGSAAGPVDGIAVAATMLDVSLPSGAYFRHELPENDSCFVYVLSGAIEVGALGTQVAAGNLAVLGNGRQVAASSASGGRLLLLAATPIG